MEKKVKKRVRTIALVAHDNRKRDIVEWVEYNYGSLKDHLLVCTGTTGKLIRMALQNKLGVAAEETQIVLLQSGPLGGDQQLGAMITEGTIDMLIFLWDPMQPQPHDVDVKALLRICSLYNIPTACNRSTADYLISSPLFIDESYKPKIGDFNSYASRSINL
ncbi:MAG: methylglyoxal synthase [Helicobacteraceae bacterium]|jgi:methylglyoxal synthase|nr:methylglyoxal synthase [Helicobacteraceae bacterium]